MDQLIPYLSRAIVARVHPLITVIKPVKNLGWLLRHWDEVKSLEVMPVPDLPQFKGWDVILKANLGAGDYYAAAFASKDVLWEWLKRPIFHGVKLIWLNESVFITREPGEQPS